MKKILLSFIFFISLFNLFGSPKKVRVGVLNGPSGIPCGRLMETKDSLNIRGLEFINCTSAQTELPKLISGELDIGFLPPNAAAKVFTAGNEALICLGITGNGNLFLITKDRNVTSLESLRGKTVHCAGHGATPEYLFKHLLQLSGLPPSGGENGVTLDFSIPNANIAAAVISDKVQYALVPEPFATVACQKSPAVRRALNLQEIFASAHNNSTYPMTLLVANAKFLQTGKDAAEKFIAAYREASRWTVQNPAHAAQLSEKHSLGLKAAIVEKSIPNASYTFIPASEGKSEIEALLSIFLEDSPESIGKKLPSDKFYYTPSK